MDLEGTISEKGFKSSKSNDRAFADFIKIADLEREVDKLVR